MMRMSRITIVGLISVIIISVILTRIVNVITISYEFEPYGSDVSDGATTSRDVSEGRPKVIGDTPSHVMWFLQISDIHLSMFNDPDRIKQFREFCNTTIDVIKPEVVLASGDLADAKTDDMIGSRQFIEEWMYYDDILKETNIPERTLWLDIRGNHDNFNVPGVNSTTSYFHRYSVQGKRHLRSYMYTITKGYEKYSFIAVDACLEPGPRRPFNFIGKLSDDQFHMLDQFEKDSRLSNATIWFGHYPTSCIISPKPGIRKLMKTGVAYMCGHLHTLGGTVPNMYTLQHTGILELELGDWKDNRLYRLAAFDHGLFSFTDVSHGEWPVILVTNPKAAEFGLPHKEPISFISNSTHIRILVFSVASIEIVQAKVDDETWVVCQHVEGPLYVAPWDPQLISSGMHMVHVVAKDKDNRSASISQSFSLDGSRKRFRLLPRFTLMTDATSIKSSTSFHRLPVDQVQSKIMFHDVFISLVVISVLPLVFIRILHILIRGNRMTKPDFSDMTSRSIIRKIWILSSVNKLFYPLVLYPLYLTVGPWFIGEIIDGHLGVAFAWGTYVKGTTLPGAFSYFYGCIQLFWFHLPFTLVVSHCVDFRFRMVCHPDSSNCSWRTKTVMNNLPCILVLLTQAMFAYYFWLAYGTIALFLGPLRTWSVIMGAYLWYCSATLQPDDLIEARIVWGNKDYYYFVGENKEDSHHAL